MSHRLVLVVLFTALSACAPVNPVPTPAVTDITATTDGEYVCVTTSTT